MRKEFVPEGRTVAKDFYLEVLGHLLKQTAWVRPVSISSMTMHRCTSQQLCSKKKKVPVLRQLAYFPNLSPPDNFAFPKLKMELKGDLSKNTTENRKSVMVKLKAIRIHEWENAMEWLKDRAKEPWRLFWIKKRASHVFVLFRDVFEE